MKAASKCWTSASIKSPFPDIPMPLQILWRPSELRAARTGRGPRGCSAWCSDCVITTNCSSRFVRDSHVVRGSRGKCKKGWTGFSAQMTGVYIKSVNWQTRERVNISNTSGWIWGAKCAKDIKNVFFWRSDLSFNNHLSLLLNRNVKIFCFQTKYRWISTVLIHFLRAGTSARSLRID